MAGVWAYPSRLQSIYIGLLDNVSSADEVENEKIECGALPFRVKAIVGKVTTGVTVASVTTSLIWRPTPGASTDAVTIATWETPVLVAENVFRVPLSAADATTAAGTSIGSASDTGGYGIGGSTRYAAESDLIVGPGGSLYITAPDGEASAGAVEFFAEVELVSWENEQMTDVFGTAPTIVTPTTVG